MQKRQQLFFNLHRKYFVLTLHQAQSVHRPRTIFWGTNQKLYHYFINTARGYSPITGL